MIGVAARIPRDAGTRFARSELSVAQVAVGRLLVIAVLVGLWALAGSSAAGATIPSPSSVAPALWHQLGSHALYSALGQTMGGWAIGLALTMVIGIAVGLLVGLSDTAYRSTKGLFDFLRAVPPVALIPLAVLVLGVSTQLHVVLIVEVCVWPVILQTTYGLRSVDPLQREVGRTLRFSPVQTFRWILLPSMLPYLATALRLAAVLGLLVAIGVELLGGVSGLGQQIFLSQSTNATPDVFAQVLIVAVIGIIVSQVFAALERRALRWHPSQRRTR
jgi:NitT/TauT family transport system permease protein